MNPAASLPAASACAVVVVPIYKPSLDAIEQFSLDHSLARLAAHRIVFIGPSDLALGYYRQRYPAAEFVGFEPGYFGSIKGYNLLLLDPAFYRRFAQHEFMLVLQTDAIILRDELAHWCARPFDYIGAPWPNGLELLINAGNFAGPHGKTVKAVVGNGGLSLRRIDATIRLLAEFPEAVDIFRKTGSSEDLFFAFMGALSHEFVLPNEMTASLFSLELKPAYYHAVNGGRLPMGGHAWAKYDPGFWARHLPEHPCLALLGAAAQAGPAAQAADLALAA